MINVFFFLVLLCELVASISQVLLKLSAGKKYPNVIREYVNPLVIGGYGLLVLSMAIGIVCYDGLGYMNVVVMEPTAYIIVMFLSRLIFKERIVPSKIIGMVLIVGGIIVFYVLG